MAASGLDHLKNDYRRRFCRPSRAPDIHTEQGQNMVEFLQDCFEEKSLANDFSTNSMKSMLCSTPKERDNCSQTPNQERQKSLPKSVPVSSKKKDNFLPSVEKPSKAARRSVHANEVDQNILETDVGSRNTPHLKNVSSRKPDDQNSGSDEEFYLSVGSPSVPLNAKSPASQNAAPSVARETYIFENSENVLSSSTEISLKTKKRLNFENKDILENTETENEESEVEDKISEGQQERKRSETSQKKIQDSEFEIQPQTKKSFSTLFLETVTRRSELSLVRHTETAPPHPPSPRNMKLLEDEFIIDESDTSFASHSWVTIPRKAGPQKQWPVSLAESLAAKASREKDGDGLPKTSAGDNQAHETRPAQKSLSDDEKRQGISCTLTDEVENNCTSTKCEIYSKNKEKSSRNKRTAKQKRKFKGNIVEEQLDVGHAKKKKINMSHTAHDKLQRNLGRNNDQKAKKNDISKKISPTGSKQKKKPPKGKQDSNKKQVFIESKNKVVAEEMTLTVMRSQRISRRPSDWWMVKSQESPVHSNCSPIRNELPVHRSSRQKPAKRANQSSKNTGKKTAPPKRQKTRVQGSSRAQKTVNDEDSKVLSVHNEVPDCSQSDEPMENDESHLAKKRNSGCSGSTKSSKDQDSVMTAQDTCLKSQNNECKASTELTLNSVEPKRLVLEESGPSRHKSNLISQESNSDVDEEEVRGILDDERRTSEKKIHHKLVLPSNTPNVRRTKRVRLKPLEYWRGERIDYQGTPSGGFVIGGVLSPDVVLPKRKARANMEKVNQMANGKRICLDSAKRNVSLGNPFEPTRVKDPETREIILMDLVRPQDTYQFFVKHGELKVYKTLDTPYFSTGKLILGPQEEKGKQHVGPDILVFYVNYGDLLCTLHETPYLLSTGDSFFVPSGNYYNIKNLLNEESVLLFTQIKR
ncbi:centromere protein C isoform X2 [Ochotona curzoniae]|uniref:centromere protein C isoform X2 n=1 Tax=Ochotona curzoniae TaxID=130825 RepID=UPI001B34E2BF|nr:centromere protein C isoform X2 [Ochotona curzoniae]